MHSAQCTVHTAADTAAGTGTHLMVLGGGAARQQVLYAAVQDRLGEDLQLAELSYELDVAEHLALREVSLLLLVRRQRLVLEGGERLQSVQSKY